MLVDRNAARKDIVVTDIVVVHITIVIHNKRIVRIVRITGNFTTRLP